MSLREKIMKLPVWKAVVLIFFISFLFIAIVEELFISKIFSVMYGMITRFEQTEKEEKKDWDAYEKSYEAFNKKSHDDFKSSWDKREEEFKKGQIRDICEEIKGIERDNKLLSEMENTNFKKSDEPIIRAMDEWEVAKLKREAKQREKQMKADKEMLVMYNASEKNCDEISQ
ncbi:hypothetical protein [Aquicella lusitana]|uniref:Uncharacterized protein n=1 Tax=Aquicella lusitana TaxID=254246 RepID=A0A370GD56_9COXI|nr:hypothetical protein [Aquicella lusitana]RDI41126.1 hypothetical protein C8D86_12124 [Aquicella lusitana]VVC74649.1 hypothetical protein AQULUS_24150 [Aquicella lusitana]